MKLAYLRNVTSLRLDRDACTGCGRCMEVCPHAVFVLDRGKSRIADRDACMECGACARNCPVNALWVKNGVGCAVGILNSALGRTTACCGEKQGGCCDGGSSAGRGRPVASEGETGRKEDGGER